MRLCDWDEMTKAFVPAPYLERRSIVAYFWVKLFNQPLSLWPFEVTHSENSSFFPSTNSFYSFHEQFNFTCSINSNCSQQGTSNFGSTRLNKRVNCVNKTIHMITLEIDQLILFATGYEKYEQFRYASRLQTTCIPKLFVFLMKNHGSSFKWSLTVWIFELKGRIHLTGSLRDVHGTYNLKQPRIR